MEQPGELGPGLDEGLPGRLALAVDVADGHLGPEDVGLGGRRERVPLAGDLEEILGEAPVLVEERERPLVEVKVVVRALDSGRDVELGRGELLKRDPHVVLGRHPPQPERPAPGELLRQQYRVGHVAHQRVLRCDRRDGEDRVREDRIFQGRHLRDAMLQGQHVQPSGLDHRVHLEGATQQDVQRLRLRKVLRDASCRLIGGARDGEPGLVIPHRIRHIPESGIRLEFSRLHLSGVGRGAHRRASRHAEDDRREDHREPEASHASSSGTDITFRHSRAGSIAGTREPTELSVFTNAALCAVSRSRAITPVIVKEGQDQSPDLPVFCSCRKSA